MAIIKVGDKGNTPPSKPSLNLNFVNSKTLPANANFTRSSTATYYSNERVIADQNLWRNSENIPLWSSSGRANVTVNQSGAPDTTTTADKVTQATGYDTNGGFVGDLTTRFTSGYHTFSIFVKAGTIGWIRIDEEAQVNRRSTQFDVGNGVLGTVNPDHHALIQNYENGWYRCSVTFPSSERNDLLLVYIGNFDTGSDTIVGGDYLYLWGGQLEKSETATSGPGPYVSTGADNRGTYFNYQNIIKTATNDVPRFEHDPSTGESKGLLIEEGRTNRITFSESFNNWTYYNVNLYPNEVIAPDGTKTADLFRSRQIYGQHYATRQPSDSFVDGSTYTLSVYVKAYSGANLGLYFPSSYFASSTRAEFSLSDGSLNNSLGAVETFSENVGNGWWRLGVTGTATATGFGPIYIGLENLAAYTGDLWAGYALWGCQLEAGYNMTSYIPTDSSSKTRSLDFCHIPISGFDFDANQGTIYSEVNLRGSEKNPAGADARRHIFSLGENITYGWITGYADINSFDSLFYYNYDSGVNIYNGVSYSDYYADHKYAMTYQSFANGSITSTISLDGSDVATTTADWESRYQYTDLVLGKMHGSTQRVLNGTIAQLSYYPEVLTEEQLIEITEE